MGFDKFGYVSFTSESKVKRFVQELEKGKLAGTKCQKCGAAYFPPRADCADCLGNEMSWYELSEKGVVVSYTKLSYAPVGFEADLPYTLALAEFDGFKVFGRLSKEIMDSERSVGMAVRIRIINLPGEKLSYEFVR
ncbi:MAG: Zn-ribbon domain-containing OB-fold protein [Desulfotomaculaceae bacterium]